MLTRLETYLTMLRENPASFVIFAAYTAAAILISLILHECAHGYAAYRCGDPTAKLMGRLSLNPARHLDPLGTLCMVVLGFGWARPVPVNPSRFRHGRRDDFIVSIAGILTNLALAMVCLFTAVVLNRFLWSEELLAVMVEEFGTVEALVNPYYGWVLNFGGENGLLGASVIMNDGHLLIERFGMFMQHPWIIWVQRFLLLMAVMNLTLAIFNLLPIPPLDGYRIVNATLLGGKFQLRGKAFQIAQGIAMVLVLTGVFSQLLMTCNEFLGTQLVRLFLMITGQQ